VRARKPLCGAEELEPATHHHPPFPRPHTRTPHPAAGLATSLKPGTKWTILAPTNAAFEKRLKALGLTAAALLENKVRPGVWLSLSLGRGSTESQRSSGSWASS
jgi:hypothetical protein